MYDDPGTCRLFPDGEFVWESAGDAGFPEGVSANPGGENRLDSGLQHAGDPHAVQGTITLTITLASSKSTYSRLGLWVWPVQSEKCSGNTNQTTH